MRPAKCVVVTFSGVVIAGNGEGDVVTVTLIVELPPAAVDVRLPAVVVRFDGIFGVKVDGLELFITD